MWHFRKSEGGEGLIDSNKTGLAGMGGCWNLPFFAGHPECMATTILKHYNNELKISDQWYYYIPKNMKN